MVSPLSRGKLVQDFSSGVCALEELRLSGVWPGPPPWEGTVTTHLPGLVLSPDGAGGSWRQSHCRRRNRGFLQLLILTMGPPMDRGIPT